MLQEDKDLHHENSFTLDQAFIDLYLMNAFYSSSDFSSFTLLPQPNYYLWTELHELKFSGYELDSSLILQPKCGNVMPYSHVKEILLSNDLNSDRIKHFE